MKVIAIDIDKNKAIFYALEKDSANNLINLTGDFKSLVLNNDTDNSSVREFQSTIHSFFDDINPNRVAIITRQTKGRFKAAPLSFKIEGLIQCYNKIEVEFIAPATLSAFYKKNKLEAKFSHNYQEPVAKLAFYLL